MDNQNNQPTGNWGTEPEKPQSQTQPSQQGNQQQPQQKPQQRLFRGHVR